MKHWLWYGLAFLLAALLGILPFTGTDIAQLKPVEAILVKQEEHMVSVVTDTMDAGEGETLSGALDALETHTAGVIFLETVDYLLINEAALPLLQQLAEYLRPACSVCLLDGEVDMSQVVPYFTAHKPQTRLHNFETDSGIETLVVRKGRMELVR